MSLSSALRRAVSDRLYELGPSRYYAPAYSRIAESLGLERGRYLDVGCGPGGLVVTVARRHAAIQALGVDTSARMIAYAHGRARGLPNATFALADAAATGLTEGSFQVATAVQTAHHWPDPAAILREVHRVLAPGGRLHLYEADSEARIVPAGWIHHVGPWPPDATVKAGWKRFGMDGPKWAALVAVAEASPFVRLEDGRHGFYRRLVLTKAGEGSSAR